MQAVLEDGRLIRNDLRKRSMKQEKFSWLNNRVLSKDRKRLMFF